MSILTYKMFYSSSIAVSGKLGTLMLFLMPALPAYDTFETSLVFHPNRATTPMLSQAVGKHDVKLLKRYAILIVLCRQALCSMVYDYVILLLCQL